MTFAEWTDSVPGVIRDDSLWTVEAYRLSLFPADISWKDAKKLSGDNCTRSLSDQRGYKIKEETAEYKTNPTDQEVPF